GVERNELLGLRDRNGWQLRQINVGGPVEQIRDARITQWHHANLVDDLAVLGIRPAPNVSARTRTDWHNPLLIERVQGGPRLVYRTAVVPRLAGLEITHASVVAPDRFRLVLLHGVDAHRLQLFDFHRDDALVLRRGVAGGDGHTQLLAILLVEAIRTHGVAVGFDDLFGLCWIVRPQRVAVV